jgi:PAS domain S-box-containing protein
MTADEGANVEAAAAKFDAARQRIAALEATRSGAAFCGELVEHMLDGFSLLTPDGVHLDVNPALCEMTGFSRDELVGVGPPHPYWPPEESAAVQAAFQRTLEGKTETFPLTFMRKGGERFPVLVTPSVIRDAEGARLGRILIEDVLKTGPDAEQRERIMEALALFDRAQW